jgi:hypothetical protein
VEEAGTIHRAIPADLLTIAHHRDSADSIIYSLILTTMKTHGQEAMQLIAEHRNTYTARQSRDAYHLLQEHPDSIRLPVLDIALATLEALPDEAKSKILSLCQALISVDEKFTLYEFIYISLVEKYLQPDTKPGKPIKSYGPVEDAVAVLLSAIVLASGNTPDAQQGIFLQTMKGFSEKDYTPLLVRPPTLETLNKATLALNRLTPLLKQPLIDACVDCILHDSKVTPNEANLLRAVCERLDCPMPVISEATSTAPKR